MAMFCQHHHTNTFLQPIDDIQCLEKTRPNLFLLIQKSQLRDRYLAYDTSDERHSQKLLEIIMNGAWRMEF